VPLESALDMKCKTAGIVTCLLVGSVATAFLSKRGLDTRKERQHDLVHRELQTNLVHGDCSGSRGNGGGFLRGSDGLCGDSSNSRFAL